MRVKLHYVVHKVQIGLNRVSEKLLSATGSRLYFSTLSAYVKQIVESLPRKCLDSILYKMNN